MILPSISLQMVDLFLAATQLFSNEPVAMDKALALFLFVPTSIQAQSDASQCCRLQQKKPSNGDKLCCTMTFMPS